MVELLTPNDFLNLRLLTDNNTSDLDHLIGTVPIKLKGYSHQLHKLDPTDFLPRYHNARIEVINNTNHTIEYLLLKVFRVGSKIGNDNFDLLPIRTYNLKPKEKAEYELMVFDPFNEPFSRMEISIATEKDWKERPKVDKWLSKAGEFGCRVKKHWIKNLGSGKKSMTG